MKLNKSDILQLVEDGYLLVNTHPEYPLSILNYSRKAQFERYWNEYTLLSRGLILDQDFEVVALPFKKFFNYEEIVGHASYPNAPFNEYEIYDKMDGSLGIIFYYDGLWHIATRGSFISEQSKRGREILKRHDLFRLNPNYTYLVEIIYPENRIVVNYDGAEKLVLLGIMDSYSGHDLTYDEMVQHVKSDWPSIEVVVRYDPITDINELKKRNLFNQEGYVMRRGDFRMKCKFEDYCRLHAIITNISTKDIWDALRNKRSINELLENTPDEFDEWVRNQVASLNEEFDKIKFKVANEFLLLYEGMGLTNKKDFAFHALQSKYSPILFHMFDNKNFDHIVWKMIEPKWSKPFFKQDNND